MAFQEFSGELAFRIETADLSLGIDMHDSRYSESLRYYLLLTHWPELVDPALDPGERFYGRYFWFRTFSNQYQAVHGFDAGIEQQCFQLIEQADIPIDWSLIEQLDLRATISQP